jgi:hypothetical protein
MAKPKAEPLPLFETVVVASVAVLGVAALLWFIFPKARPAIASAVIASPIPPIP